jgi:SAM-dependent methyltransferase
MTDVAQRSITLTLLDRAHRRAAFDRRVRVLAELLAERIPDHSSVLDIGCGDGTLGALIKGHNPSVQIEGLEIAPRPMCQIPCSPFDGTTIPYPNAAFDICMFVDVLHHTNEIASLLSEATRVSKRFVLVKEHLSENGFDFKVLQFMDWIGNRPHGVVLPYNYQSRGQWNEHFSNNDLVPQSWLDLIPLYPFPFSALFGRKLHFIALLEKCSAVL